MTSGEQTKPQPSAPNAAARHAEMKLEVIEFIKMVVWFLAIFLVLRWGVIEGYEVQGPSMEPTLRNGDRILVFKLTHLLGFSAASAGDIVVFRSPEDSDKQYVKRVVAKGPMVERSNTAVAKDYDGGLAPRDGITVDIEGGALYINKKRVDEDYLPEGAQHEIDSDDQIVLKPGDYYVLGDNRRRSKDSRVFGPVPDDKLIGRAVLRFWPIYRISLLK